MIPNKNVEKEIRNFLKNINGKFYDQNELLVLLQNLKERFPCDKLLEFISQYCYFTKKDQKIHFNVKKKQNKFKINSEGIVEEINLSDETFMKMVKDENENANKTNLESEISSDTFRKLDEEFMQQLVQAVDIKPVEINYTYPVEKYNYSKKEDQTFGSQWIHENQKNDEIDDKVIQRRKQFDKLRAIKLPVQRSPEWFAMRNDKITASDGGTVIGQNKYEPVYNFILKKTIGSEFKSNLNCYHGKKYEQIATMIYEYRMNVHMEEFGLLAHPEYSFLGASPDGICSYYKKDKKHLSKYVGRMLEIKCPLVREIKKEGDIIDNICPIYYWVQVQLQLECCNLDECDFWQCKIKEYPNREAFIKDSDHQEPFRTKNGLEKGCIIQLLPKNKMLDIETTYDEITYEDAAFIYPDSIEMTPMDCDIWLSKTISNLHNDQKYKQYTLDKILYWKLEDSKNVTINRDRLWFEKNLPKFKKIWDYVVFLRNNIEQLSLLKSFIDTRETKYNKEIMEVVDNLCRPENPNYQEYLKNLRNKIGVEVTLLQAKNISSTGAKPTTMYKSKPIAVETPQYMFID